MNQVFDFDEPVERRGTDSLKWARYGRLDVIPMWVADMDFRSPPAVLDALARRIGHGVFGYARPSDSLVEAVCEHLRRDHGWSVEGPWIVWLPGLVCGLNVACRTAGDDGDEVLTTVPVYPPFLEAPPGGRRVLRTAPMAKGHDGRWRFDLAALEAAVTPRTKLFLLCSPHNPLGRCWDGSELRAIADFCRRHDLLLCSDEIHAGLVLEPELRHVPTAVAAPFWADRTITLHAPSKTFNLPGLGCAFAVIPDRPLRERFEAVMHGIVPHVNALGLAAAEAAYREGEPWRAALLDYLRGNLDRVEAAIARRPELDMTHVEATYLAWIDARRLGLESPTLLFQKHGVGLQDGGLFGASGWMRLNFGCRRALLDEALDRMRTAVDNARGLDWRGQRGSNPQPLP